MAKPIKVYIDASAMADVRKSGIGHLVLSTAQALDKLLEERTGYLITLFVPWRQWELLNGYKFKHLRYKRLPFPGRILNLMARFRVAPPLDVFLGKGIYIFPNYKNWGLYRSKSITYVHDIGFALFPQFTKPNNRKMLVKYIPLWIKRTAIVATLSQSSKREIQKQYELPAEKITVIPCGVDLKEYYRRPQAEIDRVKKKYGVEGDYLFFLSNIEPRKNLGTLIEAYKSLPARSTEQYGLLVVGSEGWLNEDILKQIKIAQAEGFRITHPAVYVPDSDLPALHSGATALVQPSFHEGFGISPLQAMACGTPVIISDIPSLRELVGQAGVYIDPSNAENLSLNIQKVIGDKELRRVLGEKGLKRAEQFNWSSAADLLLAQVDKLAR
jgi:glycosyltransferase involved in cell wall biosynthesis